MGSCALEPETNQRTLTSSPAKLHRAFTTAFRCGCGTRTALGEFRILASLQIITPGKMTDDGKGGRIGSWAMVTSRRPGDESLCSRVVASPPGYALMPNSRTGLFKRPFVFLGPDEQLSDRVLVWFGITTLRVSATAAIKKGPKRARTQSAGWQLSTSFSFE